MPASRRTLDRFVVERVAGYLDNLQNAAYVRAAFARDERRAVRTIAELLRSDSNQTVNDALLFSEDAVRFGLLPRDQALRVWGALLPAIRDLLRARPQPAPERGRRAGPCWAPDERALLR